MNLEQRFNLLQKRTFQLLIFFLPSQLSLHLWPQWSYVYGIRVDYLSVVVYFTDLIVFLFLIASLLKWLTDKRQTMKANRNVVFIILLAALFAFFNVYGAQNQQVVIFKLLKYTQLILLAVTIKSARHFSYKDWFLKPMMASLVLFSLIGIGQFLKTESIGGLLYYLGERRFSISSPGIARASVMGKEYLRAYSTFSHPNSFAGFYLTCLFLVAGYKIKERHLKHFKIVCLVFVFLALFSTLSFGAMSILLALLIFKNIIPEKKLFKTASTLFFVVILSSLCLPLTNTVVEREMSVLKEDKFRKRILLSEASAEMFSERPFVGVGLNNFVVKLPQTGLPPDVSWWLQPVHNIYLLAFSETGISGLLIMSTALYLTLRSSENKKNLTLALLAIIMTGFIDHYWLTLQQNSLLLFVVGGLSFRKKLS